MTTGLRSLWLLAGLVPLWGCVPQESASAAEAKHERIALVDVLAVQVGPIASSIEATANLVAERQVAVVAEQDGRLLELAVDEGQDIAAGDLVGVLDGRSAKNAIAAAKIKVSGASATHGRADKLARQQLLAAEELEKLGNARESAAQELASAKWQLTRTRVRAPISGRVTKRHVVAGKWVRTGDPIVDVTDFGVLVARIHIPERDALRLAPGREATLILQADASVRFTGLVRRIAEVVDVKSGTVEIVIEVTEVPPQVRSGSFVAIRIEREREAMAQWIPREAIVRESSGAVVFVVEDGVAHRRELELGTEQGARVAVRSGVVAGELVVLAGQTALRDGEAVQLRPVVPAGAAVE
jgi:membrane fusion protein, multidrug efflux system